MEKNWLFMEIRFNFIYLYTLAAKNKQICDRLSECHYFQQKFLGFDSYLCYSFDLYLRQLYKAVLFYLVSEMGACFSDANPSSRQGGTTATNQVGMAGKSMDSINNPNPELLQETLIKKSSCPTSITTDSLVEGDQKVKSVISLEDAFQKSKVEGGQDEEIQNLEEWILSHNTTSSIIKMPKSKRNTERNKQQSGIKQSKIFSELEDCQDMDGDMQTNRHMTKIVLKNDHLDIQFMLPRSRAGPLVVPYISYQRYDLSGRSK